MKNLCAKTVTRDDKKLAKRLLPSEVFRTSYGLDRVETVALCKELIRRAVETKVELEHHQRYGMAPGFDAEAWARLLREGQQEEDAEKATRVLLARENDHEGWGASQEQIDKIIASRIKSATKAYG